MLRFCKSLFIPFTLCFVLFSCYVDKDPYLVFDSGAYDYNLKKWNKLECDNYSFSYTIQDGSTGPQSNVFTVTVTDGVSSYTVKDPEGNTVDPSSVECEFPTVESLFDKIEDIRASDQAFLDTNPSGIVCYELECEYNKKTGIPESFSNSLWNTGLYTKGDYKVTITNINVPEQYLENAGN